VDKVATRAITRFHCLGGDCEDNCCRSGWGIAVDREHYELLRARLPPAELDAAIRLRQANRGPHALMVLQDGACTMLDGRGLCSIHARYGEELLPDICTMYPRLASLLGDRLELIGLLSCPEMARLVLLADDGLDLVPVEREVFGRGVVMRTADADDFAAVRALLDELLALDRYPLASRLFFLAYVADRRVGRAVHAALDQLHAQFQALAVPPEFGASVVGELLALAREKTATNRTTLHALLDQLRPNPAPAPPRLDTILTRYARHYLLSDWATGQPSLVHYVMALLARVAFLRHLLVHHPDVDRDLDRLAVRAAYAVYRMLDHNDKLANRLVDELDAQGMTRLEHAICLAKMVYPGTSG
jgi:lysine-N-methylase